MRPVFFPREFALISQHWEWQQAERYNNLQRRFPSSSEGKALYLQDVVQPKSTQVRIDENGVSATITVTSSNLQSLGKTSWYSSCPTTSRFYLMSSLCHFMGPQPLPGRWFQRLSTHLALWRQCCRTISSFVKRWAQSSAGSNHCPTVRL